MGLRHLDVLKSLDLAVLGVADRFDAALAKAAEAGVPHGNLSTEPEALLRKLKAECVVVATTAPSHADLVCLAAESGAKVILCEKPMAVSLEQCDRMIEVCRKHGTRLAINHQMRFMEQYTRPREIVWSEAFGGLASVNVVAGNFGMAMNASHYFEMFRYMTGSWPAKVNAWFSAESVANPRGREFEDRAGQVRLETADGRRFYLDAGADQGHGMLVSYGGRNGRIDVDELAGKMRLVVRRSEHRGEPTTRYGMPWEETVEHITPADAVAPTRSVMQALLAGNDFPDGAVGRGVIEILVAAQLSHEAGGGTIELAKADLPVSRMFPWA
jgi:predicted dehydrogenase